MSSGQPLLTSLHGILILSVSFTTVCSTIIFLYAFHFFMSSLTPSLEMVLLSGRASPIGHENYGNDCSLGEGKSNRTRKLRQ